jgi:5' nucleotidase family
MKTIGSEEKIGSILARRPDVERMLKALRASGKRLFLATNSDFAFARLVARAVLGAQWRSYFDLVVVNAGKGAFFGTIRPFLSVSPDGWGDDGTAHEFGMDAQRDADDTSVAGDARRVVSRGNAAAIQALADTLRHLSAGGGDADAKHTLLLDSEGHVVGGAIVPPEREEGGEDGGSVFASASASAGAASSSGSVGGVGATASTRTPTLHASSVAESTDPRADSLTGASDRVHSSDARMEVERAMRGWAVVVPVDARDVLAAWFERRTHARVAYVGDHPLSDVVASRRHLGWKSIAVAEEIALDASGLRELLNAEDPASAHTHTHTHASLPSQSPVVAFHAEASTPRTRAAAHAARARGAFHRQPSRPHEPAHPPADLGAKWGPALFATDLNEPSWLGETLLHWASAAVSDVALLDSLA